MYPGNFKPLGPDSPPKEPHNPINLVNMVILVTGQVVQSRFLVNYFPSILSAFARTDEDKTLGLAMLCGYAQHPPLGMHHLNKTDREFIWGEVYFFDLDVFIQCYGRGLQTYALIFFGKVYLILFTVFCEIWLYNQ